MENKKSKNDAEKTNEQQLFLETKNRKIRSNGKLNTPTAEEGYCNEATQGRPSTHSHSCQAQYMSKNTEVKQRMAWAREEIQEVIWSYMYCRKYLTDFYEKVYEIWRQLNPGCRMYMDAKKLINQKNSIIEKKKITEMKTEEIRKELQENQRSHTGESEGKQL